MEPGLINVLTSSSKKGSVSAMVLKRIKENAYFSAKSL